MIQAQAILVAGGTGNRFRSATPKQFLTVLEKPLVIHALERLQRSGAVARVVVVLPQEGFEKAERLVAPHVRNPSHVDLVPGGTTRQESMERGLSRIEPFDGLVAVHDAARCAVPRSLVARVVEAAGRDGGAIAALPVTETLKLATSELVVERTVPREGLYRAQTPQCFRYDLLARAARRAAAEGFTGTDEAALVERLGVPIRIVLGSEQNLKVTTAEDLERVRYYLERGED